MCDKLAKQITVELNQLHHLLENHRPLLQKCLSEKPDPIERSALAAMLHSFYTGIENILKRVALKIDGGLPPKRFFLAKAPRTQRMLIAHEETLMSDED